MQLKHHSKAAELAGRSRCTAQVGSTAAAAEAAADQVAAERVAAVPAFVPVVAHHRGTLRAEHQEQCQVTGNTHQAAEAVAHPHRALWAAAGGQCQEQVPGARRWPRTVLLAAEVAAEVAAVVSRRLPRADRWEAGGVVGPVRLSRGPWQQMPGEGTCTR